MIKHIYESTWRIWMSEWGHWFASNGKAILTSATKENIHEQIREYNSGPKQNVPEQYQVRFKGSEYKGSNQ